MNFPPLNPGAVAWRGDEMGMTASAELVYGFCWAEAPALDDDEVEWWDEWEEKYARLQGLAEPEGEYPRDGDTSARAQEVKAAYSTYWDAKHALTAACPIKIGTHGYIDEGAPFVFIKASRHSADWGSPLAVDGLAAQENWAKQLTDFCALMGIEPPEDRPRWWLTASYG